MQPPEKPIHPSSRKARQMTKQAAHETRKANHAASAGRIKNTQVAKMQWFKDHMDPAKSMYSVQQVCELIGEYFQRHDDELDNRDAQKDRHKPRPPSLREEFVKTFIDKEKADFGTNGFLAPDLTRPAVVRELREWNGQPSTLERIQMRKFKPQEDMILIGGGSITAISAFK